MAQMKRSLRIRGKQAAENISKFRARAARGQLDELRARVEELESEVQEARQTNLRLAELTDVVQELLLPVAQRDEQRVTELMERYSRGL